MQLNTHQGPDSVTMETTWDVLSELNGKQETLSVPEPYSDSNQFKTKEYQEAGCSANKQILKLALCSVCSL